MDDEQRYAAASSKDARFDGVFFCAVRTTGIYCRPSCPAITPKRVNIVFYPTAAAAQQAGFRAAPLGLARAQRARTARVLIETTKLPMGDIAFAAGFTSIRQFNATILEVYDTPPSVLRERAMGRAK